jgi:hypothetical protein
MNNRKRFVEKFRFSHRGRQGMYSFVCIGMLIRLAVGPTLNVRILERDFEATIRFILSNLKGKKSHPTSLSSLNALATALETRLIHVSEPLARITWGCIQETRKIIEASPPNH